MCISSENTFLGVAAGVAEIGALSVAEDMPNGGFPCMRAPLAGQKRRATPRFQALHDAMEVVGTSRRLSSPAAIVVIVVVT
jgi:hypothetical protein